MNEFIYASEISGCLFPCHEKKKMKAKASTEMLGNLDHYEWKADAYRVSMTPVKEKYLIFVQIH